MPASIALVTGPTEGIGHAIAFALGRSGYRVGVCSRTGARIEALLAELRAEGITARAVLPGMRERKSGVIVNVASLAGKNPIAGGTAYVASKHGTRSPSAPAGDVLPPEDVAQAILDALRMPGGALVSEIDIRPANP